MERGRQKRENMDGDLSTGLKTGGHICFSCEQIFADRKSLEDHVCFAASFICSCGTEFSEYKDMHEHSTTHEPGHQVLDHETIKKRRMEKSKAEEAQLKRIETGEVVWKLPKLNNGPSQSLPVKPVLQVPIRSAQISQTPALHPSLSQASVHTDSVSPTAVMKNIFADVGAPTVDLWTLYQPVVLLQTKQNVNKKKPYSCGKCGQCFMSKLSLVSHHSIHVTDKVSGCIGCGLLLSSKKLVPRFHNCNAPNTATKLKIITAKPLQRNLPGANGVLFRNTRAAITSSSLGLQSQKFSAAGGTLHMTSPLQLKNQNITAYNQHSQGLQVVPPWQLKRDNLSPPLPRVTIRPPTKIQILNPGTAPKSCLGVTPSDLLKTSINSKFVLSRPTKTPSVPSGFRCRVCHIPFETTQLLQRHKCIKAKEFMAQHVRTGRQQYTLKRVPPVARMNGERTLGVPASAYIKRNQVMAVSLNKGQGVVQKSAEDTDDDCYIVESSPEKTAEMICQVTSSVPIKT